MPRVLWYATLFAMPSSRTSAGLLLFRLDEGCVQVLLGHMGGPFWMGKEFGAWTIPKGEYDPARENAFDVAMREFHEELGSLPPATEFFELGETKQAGGKRVAVWAGEGDFDAATAVSNTFEVEWPKGSGKIQTFPEIECAAWLSIDEARTKLVKGQVVFLDRLLAKIGR